MEFILFPFHVQMCELPYTVEPCANAEYMSPGGHMTKLPVLQCGAFVVSELEPIINLVEKKGSPLTDKMDADERNDLRAYLSLTEKIFTNAEVSRSSDELRTEMLIRFDLFSIFFFFGHKKLYICWMDKQTLEEVTYKRYGSVYPRPLNYIQNWRKRNAVVRKLKVFNWASYTNEQVIKKVRKCCAFLKDKLGTNQYFYGER